MIGSKLCFTSYILHNIIPTLRVLQFAEAQSSPINLNKSGHAGLESLIPSCNEIDGFSDVIKGTEWEVSYEDLFPEECQSLQSDTDKLKPVMLELCDASYSDFFSDEGDDLGDSDSSKGRKKYHTDYNRQRRDLQSPYWQYIAAQDSASCKKLINKVAELNKVGKAKAKSRLQRLLDAEMEADLLYGDTFEQRKAAHLLDYSSPDDLFTDSEKKVLFERYVLKKNGEKFKAPYNVLQAAKLHLSEGDKSFIVKTILKTPEDYDKIANMIKKAFYISRVGKCYADEERRFIQREYRDKLQDETCLAKTHGQSTLH